MGRFCQYIFLTASTQDNTNRYGITWPEANNLPQPTRKYGVFTLMYGTGF